MVVLEESVEVANAMVKLRSSEAKIVELRRRRDPVTAVITQAPASIEGEGTVSQSI